MPFPKRGRDLKGKMYQFFSEHVYNVHNCTSLLAHLWALEYKLPSRWISISDLTELGLQLQQLSKFWLDLQRATEPHYAQ